MCFLDDFKIYSRLWVSSIHVWSGLSWLFLGVSECAQNGHPQNWYFKENAFFNILRWEFIKKGFKKKERKQAFDQEKGKTKKKRKKTSS